MLSFETGRGVFETLSRRRRPDHPSVMQKQSLSYFYSRATELSVVEVVRTTTHLIQRPCYQQGSPCQDPAGSRATRRPPDHRKETQTVVVWSCLVGSEMCIRDRCYPGEYSGLEPSSVISESRYLKLVTVSSFCPFTLILSLIHI